MHCLDSLVSFFDAAVEGIGSHWLTIFVLIAPIFHFDV